MNFNAPKAVQHRVVMLAGDEEGLRRRAFHELLIAANIEKDDFDMVTMMADSQAPMDWYASVSTAPFLSERRVTIVRHLLRCDLDKLKGTDLSKLPETSLLILIADDETGDENRQKSLKTARNAWVKAIEKAGGGVYVFDPDPKNSLETVKREATNVGKKLSPQAAELLVEMTGGSLSRALEELKKIELFIGDQEQIRESDVQEVVVPSREWNVYKMVDSVFNGQVPEALRQLRVLIGSQTKAEDAAFSRILPTLTRQLRLVWQARLCIEARCHPTSPTPEVQKLFTAKPNLSAESSFSQKKAMAIANRINLTQIQKCFGILADTDARLKGSLYSFSAMEALERMLLDMATVVATK